MKKCRVCGLVINCGYVCNNCEDTKFFKCYCCKELFSFNDIKKRNLKFGSKYKCLNPNIKKSKCTNCKKLKYLLLKQSNRCITCTMFTKNNIDYTVHRLEKEYQMCVLSKADSEDKIEKLRQDISNLCQITDIFENKCTVYTLFNLISDYKLTKSIYKTIKNEMKKLSQQQITMSAEQMKQIKKSEDIFQCIYGAQTFLLCGLRPQVCNYIPKPLQNKIVKHMLSSIFNVHF